MVYGSVLSELSTKTNREVVTHQGGVAYASTLESRFNRFLIIGTEGGTYYVRERELTRENAKVVQEALDTMGPAAVDRMVQVSEDGLALKQEPVLMALAMASAHSDLAVRRAALAAIPRVCRTGTMLFTFAEYVQTLRGWGRGLRNAIGRWYNDQAIPGLVYQGIKYRQRGGWTHADLLRLAHPKTSDPVRNALYKWLVDGETGQEQYDALRQLYAFVEVQSTDDKQVVIRAIRDARLPREALPTRWLNDPDIWDALLHDMPMMAMVRNLGNMSKAGLLVPGSDAERRVVERLSQDRGIKASRVHPLDLFEACVVYALGRSVRGHGSWNPSPKVIDALNDAVYKAFDNVEPTNKRMLVAIDVSGSMSYLTNGSVVQCADVAAMMALINASTEPAVEIVAFDTGLYHPRLSPRQRFDDVKWSLYWKHGGGTDIRLPFQYAVDHQRFYDAIVVYTDNEHGGLSVQAVIDAYRRKINPQLRVVVGAMAANEYSFARPDDPLMLDIVGFSPNVTTLIQQFVSGMW